MVMMTKMPNATFCNTDHHFWDDCQYTAQTIAKYRFER